MGAADERSYRFNPITCFYEIESEKKKLVPGKNFVFIQRSCWYRFVQRTLASLFLAEAQQQPDHEQTLR